MIQPPAFMIGAELPRATSRRKTSPKSVYGTTILLAFPAIA